MTNNDILAGFDDQKDNHLTFQLTRIAELPKCVLVNLKGHADRDNNTFFSEQLSKIAKSDFRWMIIGCSDFEIHNNIVSFDVILRPIAEKQGGIVLIGIQPSLTWYLDSSLGSMTPFLVRKNNLNEALEFIKRKLNGLIRFPMDFDCPVCGRTINRKGVGAHICYGCRTILILDACGDVSLARPQSEGSLEELPQAEDDTENET